MRIVQYVTPLGPNDRYRHYHTREKRRVVEFSVQYETLSRGAWYPVVRYDTAHGYAHRDLLDIDGVTAKTLLPIADFNDALTCAEADIKANWKMYKERFLRRRKP